MSPIVASRQATRSASRAAKKQAFGAVSQPVPNRDDDFAGVAQYETMGTPRGYSRGFIFDDTTDPIRE